MPTDLYPLLFTPLYKQYLWGGHRIRERFRNHLPPLYTCAESWELADRPEGMSLVANGPLAGTTLGALVQKRRHEILGPAAPEGPFPLLIKILDARERLSVQVHPDNATAALRGGEPKTEMWVVLDAAPRACLYAGLRPGATPDVMRASLAEHNVESLLQVVPVAAGHAVFIPGGCVHAIGEGCLILEVQQNSNTTYRLHDWDRVGPDGKPRELHLEQALEVIRWDDQSDTRLHPTPLENRPELTSERLIACPYFRVDRLHLSDYTALARYSDGCNIVFVISGEVRITAGGQSVSVPAGTTCLIPAACGGCYLEPLNGPAHLLRILPG